MHLVKGHYQKIKKNIATILLRNVNKNWSTKNNFTQTLFTVEHFVV